VDNLSGEVENLPVEVKRLNDRCAGRTLRVLLAFATDSVPKSFSARGIGKEYDRLIFPVVLSDKFYRSGDHTPDVVAVGLSVLKNRVDHVAAPEQLRRLKAFYLFSRLHSFPLQ